MLAVGDCFTECDLSILVFVCNNCIIVAKLLSLDGSVRWLTSSKYYTPHIATGTSDPQGKWYYAKCTN